MKTLAINSQRVSKGLYGRIFAATTTTTTAATTTRVSSPRDHHQQSTTRTTTRSVRRGFSTINRPIDNIRNQRHHHQYLGDHHADRLLVIGSGVAGTATALWAAETHQIPVSVLYAGAAPIDCNSSWAQGGIIYRNYDPKVGDSADLLSEDIHRAGAGLCDDDAVRKVANEGPTRVEQFLLDEGCDGAFAQVPFDRTEEGDLSLCLEASHAAPRILHRADHTGRTITEHMTEATSRHPLIKHQPNTIVTDLIVMDGVCVGVKTLDRITGQIRAEYASRGTVVASGGLAGIYQHSTNPAGFNALGSSVALAIRAGGGIAASSTNDENPGSNNDNGGGVGSGGFELRDLEYVQFHPTSLFHSPNEPRFLLTEALRGEGAILRDDDGRSFAHDYHVDGELAPRDIVARAVFMESQKSDSAGRGNVRQGTGAHNAYLDITHRDADWLQRRFPSIHGYLSQRGLDLAKDWLPVIPAAHYTCGGISTDLTGRTGLQGLYAAGEAARTGLHGGNRLASTSLLEGLVFGAAVANTVASEEGRVVHEEATRIISSRSSSSSRISTDVWSSPAAWFEPLQTQNVNHAAMELFFQVRRIMWDHVGVVRTASGLSAALDALGPIREEASHLFVVCPTLETAAVRDASYAGYAVAQAAHANHQSAGAHYIVDDDHPAAASQNIDNDVEQVVAQC